MKIKHLLLPVCIASYLISASSCSHTDETEPALPDGTLREISFSLGGEFIDVSEEPLSRAEGSTAKKYYAMNILKYDNNKSNYSYLAYGVFDDLSKMTIALETGTEYKFECTTIEEAGDEIATETIDGVEYFKYPFELSGDNKVTGSTSISYYLKDDLNKFCPSNGNMYLTGLGAGKTTVVSDDGNSTSEKLFPRTVRYYGELEGFNPSVGSTATITLKSASFGIKVVVDNMPGGTLTWKEEYTLKYSNLTGISGTGKKENITKFTFSDVKNCWKITNYTGPTVEINFTWQPDGGIAKKYTAEVDLKRNIMTVIKVELSSYDKNITFNITEEGSMTEDDPVVAAPK
jgi:hypothetical protein